MQKPKAALAPVILILAQSVGCAWIQDGSKAPSFPGAYKIDVQQGNIITPETVARLHTGMTRNQVLFVMGPPLLPDAYNRHRWDYVYTFKPGGKEWTRKAVSLFFNDDKLVRIEGNKMTG